MGDGAMCHYCRKYKCVCQRHETPSPPGFTLNGVQFHFLTRREDGRLMPTEDGDLYAAGWCPRARKDRLERAMLDAVTEIDAGNSRQAIRDLLMEVLCER